VDSCRNSARERSTRDGVCKYPKYVDEIVRLWYGLRGNNATIEGDRRALDAICGTKEGVGSLKGTGEPWVCLVPQRAQETGDRSGSAA
jgi:hypothetical protein